MNSRRLIFNILTFIAFLLPALCQGAERYTVLNRIYSLSYDRNPSRLAWWDMDEWALIGTEAYLTSGQLHSPMSSDGAKGFGVKAESLLHQKENGWSFKGSFGYSIGMTDSLRANLSYRLKPYGSPSFYWCKVPATTWEVQRYSLSGTAVKNFDGRWALGFQVDYIGDKQFRKNDVRNEQTALEIALEAGGSVLLGRNLLSAGLLYERNREQPDFSRIYNTSLDYSIYLMNGLGTQIANMYSNVVWTQNVPGVYAGWEYRGQANRLNVKYSFRIGSDGWENTSTQSASKQVQWTRYDFTAHQVGISDVWTLPESQVLILSADFDCTSGKSSTWSQASESFIKDYNASLYGGKLGAEYHREGWFRRAGLDLSLDAENRLDKNYNARLKFLTLESVIFAGLGMKAHKTDLSLDFTGGYAFSPQVTYSPGAAREGSNFYTTYVGLAQEQWLNTRRWRAGVSLRAEVPVGKTGLEVGAAYNYTGAVASELDFQECSIFLSVYF